jgi:hypothetical protein
MKKMFCWINIFTLSFFTFNASGQQDKSSKLEISLGGGLSLPVGSYSNNNPSESAIYVNPTFPTIIGFAKEENGFAKKGSYFDFQVDYKLTPKLKLLLNCGTFNNQVDKSGMSDLLVKTVYNNEIREVVVNHESYKYLFITPGIGYYYSFNKINLGLNLFIGYLMTGFPYYEFVYYYTAIPYPGSIFGHDGPRPNLGALTLGTSLSVSYNLSDRLKVGLNTYYQRANFAYKMHNKFLYNSSGDIYEISDILKVRVLNTGLTFKYSF